MEQSAIYSAMDLRIEHAVNALRSNGALGVDDYERKLKNNFKISGQVVNHLSEARVALMFIENGAKVWMRDSDSPDLMIEWDGELFYAEVKHFLRKDQDEIDEQAEKNASGLFVRVGDTLGTEGRHPWEQISDVARRKKRQYVDGATNILVIDSGSESLEFNAASGANEYDDELLKTPNDPALPRLHAIMVINLWGTVAGGFRNVDLARTKYAVPRMSYKLKKALREIRTG